MYQGYPLTRALYDMPGHLWQRDRGKTVLRMYLERLVLQPSAAVLCQDHTL